MVVSASPPVPVVVNYSAIGGDLGGDALIQSNVAQISFPKKKHGMGSCKT